MDPRVSFKLFNAPQASKYSWMPTVCYLQVCLSPVVCTIHRQWLKQRRGLLNSSLHSRLFERLGWGIPNGTRHEQCEKTKYSYSNGATLGFIMFCYLYGSLQYDYQSLMINFIDHPIGRLIYDYISFALWNFVHQCTMNVGYCVKVKAQKVPSAVQSPCTHTYWFSSLLPFNTPSIRLRQTPSPLIALDNNLTNNPSSNLAFKKTGTNTLWYCITKQERSKEKKIHRGKKKEQ